LAQPLVNHRTAKQCCSRPTGHPNRSCSLGRYQWPAEPPGSAQSTRSHTWRTRTGHRPIRGSHMIDTPEHPPGAHRSRESDSLFLPLPFPHAPGLLNHPVFQLSGGAWIIGVVSFFQRINSPATCGFLFPATGRKNELGCISPAVLNRID